MRNVEIPAPVQLFAMKRSIEALVQQWHRRPLYLVAGQNAESHSYANHTPRLARKAGFALMRDFWPGPLTIILPRADIVPEITAGGRDNIAMRVPDHPVARDLIRACGTALVGPSANKSGRPSPITAADVLAEADYVGSTAGMIKKVGEARAARVVLITECSMSDNVAVAHPEVEFVRPCNLCPHMKRITLPKVLDALEYLQYAVEVDPAIAGRARRAVERMLEM